MPGTLYIVATPIGNLEDITLRALRVLREVAVIAAEDTRRTAKLLSHFDIHTPSLSLHAHNERARAAQMVARLRAGANVALVTDAGTPLVSDPGAELVRAAREAGARVEAVPGPSALLAALVSAGLPADTFTFLGFPPPRSGARRAWLAALSGEPRTVVFFEAPHRIAHTLRDLASLFPDRQVALGRELTKVHEQVIAGTAAEVLTELGPPRGEFTVVVGPAPPPPDPGVACLPDPDTLWQEFRRLAESPGMTRRSAIASLATRYGRTSREIYRAVERARPRETAADPPSADR